MDDAVICGQLRQIFPQIELHVIERTVEEAKTNEGVDILTHCIEVVLARQEQATWFANNNYDQQGNDDVVVVRSIRKETSRKGKTRDIPLVYVKEDRSDSSDYDSDSSIPESSDDEGDFPVRFIDKNNYFEGSSSIMNEFYDENLDRLITNMRVPPTAIPDHQQMATPASQPKSTVKTFNTDKQQHLVAAIPNHPPSPGLPAATPNLQPSVTPNRQPLVTPNCQPLVTPNCQPLVTFYEPNRQPAATLNPQPSLTRNRQIPVMVYRRAILNHQLAATLNCQPTVTLNRQPAATPNSQPSATPNCQPSATPNRPPSATPNRQPSATPNRQPSATPNRKPSATPNRQPSATPIRQHSAMPTQPPSTTTITKPSTTPGCQLLATPIGIQSLPPKQYVVLSATLNQSTMPESTQVVSVANSPLDVIRQMYPKVNVDFIQNLSQQGYDLNGIVNVLIDRPDMQNSGSSSKEPAPTKEIDYFTEFSQMVLNPCYYQQCVALLRNEFQRVSVNNIRKAMGLCNDHYAPARKLLEEALLDMNQNQKGKSPQTSTLMPKMTVLQKNTSPTTSSATPKKKFTISQLLASKRTPIRIMDKPCPELQLEIDFVEKRAMLNEEKKNAIYAAHLNKQQYVDEGELIECGCCFGEFPFEEIVQCSDGHLFCKECLHGYAKEIIFGSAMASAKLSCMGEDCDQPFPYNQLEKCLTKDEIEKYQCRLQEDCLAKADIPNFRQCAFCEFAAIIPEHQKVFTCMNPKCMKEWCIECKEEWKDHFGKKCNEIEKKSQTNLRLSYEERMTMAKVRKCSKCSLTFTKLDGCNKMTCRCGTTQCYVCRKSAINYDHFCRHPRDPGKKCQKCAACSLWTDPTEDDELAIKQLQEEAAVAKRKLMEEIQQCANKKQKVQT